MSKQFGIKCEFGDRRGTRRSRERLWAVYEINGTAMSDNYTPLDISAEELLEKWAEWAPAHHPSGIIPIFWCVRGEGIFEQLPGIEHYYAPHEEEDFLTHFTQPLRTDTREPLRWIDLPVEDLKWNLKRADKGGFIQEARGWKPAIFQPFVLIDHLLGFRRTAQVRGLQELWDFKRKLEPDALTTVVGGEE